VLDFCIAKNIADEDFTSIIQVCMLWRGVSGRGWVGGWLGGWVCGWVQVPQNDMWFIQTHSPAHTQTLLAGLMLTRDFCLRVSTDCRLLASAAAWSALPLPQPQLSCAEQASSTSAAQLSQMLAGSAPSLCPCS
jgi:hypothetical protein